MIDPVTRMKNRQNRNAARSRAKSYVRAYLEEHPCEKCGFSDPRALQFHHRDPSTKSGTVSRMASVGMPLPKIAYEMRKCSVLCANCHLIYHEEERRERK
jgi:hypothetical protein